MRCGGKEGTVPATTLLFPINQERFESGEMDWTSRRPVPGAVEVEASGSSGRNNAGRPEAKRQRHI